MPTIESPRQKLLLELRPVSTSLPVREAPSQSARTVLAARIAAKLRTHWLLFAVFLLPMLVASIYLFLIAANMYEAEAAFIVRNASNSPGNVELSSLISSPAISRADDDTQAVNAYIMSRDAIGRLISDNGLLEKLAVSEADFLQRFPRWYGRVTREQLFKRYPDFISVEVDSSTGISKLTVRTFRPEHAQEIAQALIKHSEELINRLNVRARNDAIRFSSSVVTIAEQRVAEAQERISAFRRDQRVFDPGKQSAAGFELLTKLVTQTVQIKAALTETEATAPNSPQIAALRARIGAFEQQIDEHRKEMVGGANSLAPKLAVYEQLTLQRELSTKSLASALQSLENARQQAQRQHLYLERVVTPAVPDEPRYPRRFLILLQLAGILGCLYATLRWLRAVVMEHDV